MRVIVAATFLPFHEGGADGIVDDLERELTRRGFEADTVRIPLRPDWSALPEQTMGLRLLDLSEACGERIDRVITVGTASHALRHPNKAAWLIRHRGEACDARGDAPDTEEGRRCRDMMRRSGDLYIRECKRVFTSSRAAADRLKESNNLDADGVLYPPLSHDAPFRPGKFGDYFFCPGRIAPIERQELVVEALKYTRPEVRLVIAGRPETETAFDELVARLRREGLAGRVEFTSRASEAREAELMSGCLGVLSLAHLEECCGCLTLEAFHSAKPVVTLTDCGGTLEVVEHGVNGLVAEPEPRALAEALNRLWADRAEARRLGDNARDTPRRLRIDWDHVIEKLAA